MGLFRKRIKVKACQGCGEVKTTDEFYRNKFNDDGLDKYCKGCRLGYNAEWTKKNPQRRYIHQWRYRNQQWRTDSEINLIGS